MSLSGIERRYVNIFWTIKHPLLLGCFLYIILQLINETQCSSKSDRNLIADVKNTKLHLTGKVNRKSAVHTLHSDPWLKRSAETDPATNGSAESLLHSINSKVDRINQNLEKFIRALKPVKISERNGTTILDNSSAQIDFILNNKLISNSGGNLNFNEKIQPSEGTVIYIPTGRAEEFPDETIHPSEQIGFSRNNTSDTESSTHSITSTVERINSQIGSSTEVNSSGVDESTKVGTNVVSSNVSEKSDSPTEIPPVNEDKTQQYVTTNHISKTLVSRNNELVFSTTETSTSIDETSNGFGKNESSDNVDTSTENFDDSTPPKNDNKHEPTIPGTMADVPGLDGKDDGLAHQSNNYNDVLVITQDPISSSAQPGNLPAEQEPSESFNRTNDPESSNNPKYQPKSVLTFGPEENVSNIIPKSASQATKTNTSSTQVESPDLKPYTWKRICLQGVDKIHFSLDEHVIKLPQNKADMYLFYYIPEVMPLHRSGDYLYLPNEHNVQYKGGYLKHSYTRDRSSDDFTAYSLHHHKLMHSYAKSKQTMKSTSKPSTTVRPKFNQSSTTLSANRTMAANQKQTNQNLSPTCFMLPYFHNNHSFGNFPTSHPVLPSATVQVNETVEAISKEPRDEKVGNNERPKREIPGGCDSCASADPSDENDCSRDNMKWCNDRSQCIPEINWCNQIVDCSDKSDELHCTCRDRMDSNKICDNYFDCPNGEDEKGCFGCSEDAFSCDYELPQMSNATCISMSQRCDGLRDCFDGTDELDCEILSETVDSQHEAFQTSYTSGYLHRNFKGQWYPACIETHSEHVWGVQACKSELGVNIRHVEPELLLFHGNYAGKFITHLETGHITFVDTCKYPGYAVHIKCPSIPCGNRIRSRYFAPRYHSKRQALTEAEQDPLFEALKIFIGRNEVEKLIRKKRLEEKVVGGTESQPGFWPWLVALYRDGELHCGGAIIDETWILTAGHCVYMYHTRHFEIYAGLLRRRSFSPSEQMRMVTHVIIHPEYSHDDLKNDLALLKLHEPLKFNRWVRPVCLPVDRPPWGPIAGTMCTAAGWGSIREKGPHPDSLKEVNLPVRPTCKDLADREGEEICAGYELGGRDTCQGDSGGPLLCNLPRVRDQWYIAGIVSHGEGCARAHEPGAYTRVALFIPWIVTHTDNKFLTPVRQSSHQCPGLKCSHGGRCLGLKKICDGVVDCLSAEDETDCDLPMLKSEEEENGSSSFQSPQSLGAYKNRSKITERNSTDLSSSVDASNTTDQLLDINKFKSMSQVKDLPLQDHGVLSNSDSELNEEPNIEKRETSSYFTCQHLPQDIPLEWYCDTEVDCEDGTDEINCTCADYLEVTDESLICDGIIHCYDLSDEKSCPDFNCTSDEFFCFRSRSCIPKNLVCDGSKHCLYGEDEYRCYWPISFTETIIQNQFDMFGVPLFSDKGFLAYNDQGVWKWSCFPEENEVDVPKTVQKLANRLGFKNYKSYAHLMVLNDEVLNTRQVNYCPGLSVDFAVAHVEDVSLIPWRVNIFVNGFLECVGVLIRDEWVLTDQSCCLKLNTFTDYIVAVFASDGKLNRQIRAYEEQIILVDKIRCDQQAGTTLMHLHGKTRTTEKTKSLRMPLPEEMSQIKQNYLLILEDNRSSIFELKLISSCSSASPCYKVKENDIDFCLNSNSSLQFVGVISLSRKKEWIFSGVVVESLTCLTSELMVTINLPQSFSYKENVFVNITEFYYRGHNGYRCTLGNQISWDNVCDGKIDCRENEDEIDSACLEKKMLIDGEFIKHSCRVDEFQCKNGRCVSKSTICDSINDCGDNTDEPETCSNFSCVTYLNLTNPQKLCNSQQDCPDKSDENITTCSSLCDFPSSFRCDKSNSCIPLDFVCDGERDCEFGEDEEKCISYQLTDNNGTEGTVWVRSHGKWKQQCYTTHELVAFDAHHLCKLFGYSQATKHRQTPATNDIYPRFIRVKLNNFVEINLERNIEKELNSTEYCHHLYLTCI